MYHVLACARFHPRIAVERETVWHNRKTARAVCLAAGSNAMEQFDQKAVSSPTDRRAQVKASTFVQESKSRQRNAWGGGSSVREYTGITMFWHAYALFCVNRTVSFLFWCWFRKIAIFFSARAGADENAVRRFRPRASPKSMRKKDSVVLVAGSCNCFPA